ncbi:MAG TPA: DUF3631 domain-containing protein, partial [Nitrospirales bacterium]|nr:DUF3631 domain-containing protein [Nitrospirales bacterium]
MSDFNAVIERVNEHNRTMQESLRQLEEATNKTTLASLIHAIKATITQYVVLRTASLAMLLAVWIVGTYAFQHFYYFGYLALRSATPRCGKTRLLKLIAMFALGGPPITTAPTAAVLFRTTRKVLILDEVDRLRNMDKDAFGDVMAILNSGFEQDGMVERVEKTRDGFVVKSHSVYGPKAFAGLERLADTITDRSFPVQMERTPKRMPRLNVRRLKHNAEQLRENVQAWADNHAAEIQKTYGLLPDEVDHLAKFDDRFQDISEPLLVIASLADAERPDGDLVLPQLL